MGSSDASGSGRRGHRTPHQGQARRAGQPSVPGRPRTAYGRGTRGSRANSPTFPRRWLSSESYRDPLRAWAAPESRGLHRPEVAPPLVWRSRGAPGPAPRVPAPEPQTCPARRGPAPGGEAPSCAPSCTRRSPGPPWATARAAATSSGSTLTSRTRSAARRCSVSARGGPEDTGFPCSGGRQRTPPPAILAPGIPGPGHQGVRAAPV